MVTLWSEESGQGMAEYALLLLLVALACITGLRIMGQGITGFLERFNGELDNI